MALLSGGLEAEAEQPVGVVVVEDVAKPLGWDGCLVMAGSLEVRGLRL